MEEPKPILHATIQPLEVIEPPVVNQKRRIDWPAFILGLMIMIGLIGAGGILLGIEDANDTTEIDNLRITYVFSTIFLMFASVFNEAFLTRCWQRVAQNALRGEVCSDKLRASNFGIFEFLLRMVKLSLSRKEFSVFLSYLFLRCGTLAAVPLTQLTVTLEVFGNSGYHADVTVKKNGYMIAVAIAVYCASIGLGLAFAGLPIWAVFASGYDQQALKQAYEPYLNCVPGGSIAKSQDVAHYLDNPTDRSALENLSKLHKPGIQFVSKIKCIGFGLAIVLISVGGLVAYLKSDAADDVSRKTFVYVFTFACLICNLGFTLALDQVVWNLSLEATASAHNHNRTTTKFLGNTSGVTLTFLCFMRKSTNSRARWLLWLSLVQAILVRVFFVAVITRSNFEQFISSVEKESWLFILGFFFQMIGPTIGIPFLIFVICPLRIPMCDIDGWRLAKMLENTTPGDLIAYGVKNGKACCGVDVSEFEEQVLS